MPAHYGNPLYWDDRYEKDTEHFDWYQRYNGIKDILTQYIRKDLKILMIGCGNSKLSESMIEDGYKNIHNIDQCELVIR